MDSDQKVGNKQLSLSSSLDRVYLNSVEIRRELTFPQRGPQRLHRFVDSAETRPVWKPFQPPSDQESGLP